MNKKGSMSSCEIIDYLHRELTWHDVYLPLELVKLVTSYLLFLPHKRVRTVDADLYKICENRFVIFKRGKVLSIYDCVIDKIILAKKFDDYIHEIYYIPIKKLVVRVGGTFLYITFTGHIISTLNIPNFTLLGYSTLFNSLITHAHIDGENLRPFVSLENISTIKSQQKELSIAYLILENPNRGSRFRSFIIKTGQIVVVGQNHVYLIPAMCNEIYKNKEQQAHFEQYEQNIAFVLDSNDTIKHVLYQDKKFYIHTSDYKVYEWNPTNNEIISLPYIDIMNTRGGFRNRKFLKNKVLYLYNNDGIGCKITTSTGEFIFDDNMWNIRQCAGKFIMKRYEQLNIYDAQNV